MSISTNQPENFNYFSPVSFRFNIQKIPNVNFFCQAANLPGLTLGEAIQVNPLRDIPTPGDKVQFEELQLRFIVDEELTLPHPRFVNRNIVITPLSELLSKEQKIKKINDTRWYTD